MEEQLEPIKFYRVSEEYGCFSNFSKHPINLDGKVWRTNEHYFQAQKFLDEDIKERIRNAPTPKESANMGRDRSLPLRSDWEDVKYGMMKKAVYAKFTQYEGIKLILLSTGDREIQEKTTGDYIWGTGSNGTGLNYLGKILMEVREEIRNGETRRLQNKFIEETKKWADKFV